jgi:hypothetical protein
VRPAELLVHRELEYLRAAVGERAQRRKRRGGIPSHTYAARRWKKYQETRRMSDGK